MEVAQFKAMVDRLERDAARSPANYRARVAALAAVGFGILALTLGTLALGLLLVGGGAVALVFMGGKAWVVLAKLGKPALLLALPAWILLRTAVRALLVRLPAPAGLELSSAQAPALFAALRRMRQRMRGPRVHHVLVVDDVNAAVMQRPAFGLFGWPRNYLLLGLPLLEAMPPDEALSVVAHEYGHLAGSHGRFGAFIYRLRHTWGSVQAHVEDVEGWLGRLLAPMIRWYAPYFNAYTFVLARANEYEADAAAAELVGARAAAHALMRVNIVFRQHRHFMDGAYERSAHDAAPPPDLMQRWAQTARIAPAAHDARTWLRDALDREGDFTDSHPTLRARLASLLADAASLDEPPPPLSGPSAAQAWLGDLAPMLREHFQQHWSERIETPWRERHAEARERRDRLQALRGMAARHADETLEMLRLTRLVDPGHDLRDELAAFNDAHADHAEGLFVEACARLDRDDEAGLALLERAMALDADAIKPGCGRAHAWLTAARRDDEAAPYVDRWRGRDLFEKTREAQLLRTDPSHPLVPHGLDAPTLAAVRARLAGAAVAHVAEIWLARRVIPVDPATTVLVMGIRLTWWGRRRHRHSTVIERITALPFPVSMTVLSLTGRHATLVGRMRTVEGARLV